MYKCSITKRAVKAGTPAEKVVVEIRPVIYKIMWAGGEIEKMITQTKGWETVREIIVSPEAVSQLPTIDQLLAKAKHQEPVIKIQYLKRRPKWRKPQDRRRGTMASKFPAKLKVVKE